MADQVIDADHGLVEGEGQALGGLHADQQRPREAWATGDRDAVDCARFELGFAEHFSDDRAHIAQMVARGELRNDATIWRVQLDLAVDRVPDDGAVFRDERGGSFVARGFDTENEHCYLYT